VHQVSVIAVCDGGGRFGCEWDKLDSPCQPSALGLCEVRMRSTLTTISALAWRCSDTWGTRELCVWRDLF